MKPLFLRATWVVVFLLVSAACGFADGRLICVNQARTSSGSTDGKSWATAYYTLEPALADAATTASNVQPAVICIAGGTYVPVNPGGFQLCSHVYIYGGFHIVNDQEDIPGYGTVPTVLSGEPTDNGSPMTGAVTSTNPSPGVHPVPGETAWTNNRKVLNGSGLTDVLLNGLTIADGAAYDNQKPGSAAGVTYNDSDYEGMFVYADQGPNNLTSIKTLPLTNTVIPLSPGVAGGGLSFTGAPDPKHTPLTARLGNHLTIQYCVFQANCALAYGGAISLRDTRALIQYTTFVDNYCAHDGGAISALNCIVNVQNAPFTNNSAEAAGGAVELESFPDRAETVGNEDLPDVDHIAKYAPPDQQKQLRTALGYTLTAEKVATKAAAFYNSPLKGFAALKSTLCPASSAESVVTSTEKMADLAGKAFAALSFGVAAANFGLEIAQAAGANFDDSDTYHRWEVFSNDFANYTTPQGWASLLISAIYNGGLLPNTPDEVSGRYGAVVTALDQCDGYPSLFLGCSFTGNSGAGGGGAMRLVHHNVQIEQTVFSGNKTLSDGAAIDASGFMIPTIFNSTFYQNSSVNGDSAITNTFSSFMQLINCTLYQNTSQNKTGVAFSAATGSDVRASNSIFWGNVNLDPANASGGADIYCATSSLLTGDALKAYNGAGVEKVNWIATMELNYCDIQSLDRIPRGSPHFYILSNIRFSNSSRAIDQTEAVFAQNDAAGTLDQVEFFNSGEGVRSTHGATLDPNGSLARDFKCICADPQFLVPVNGSSDPPVTPAPTSPVVDAGDDRRILSDVPHPLTLTDVLTQPRRRGASVDIGAVEAQGGALSAVVIFVKAGATGGGTSWDNATGDLGNAMNTPQALVYVMEGTYHPSLTDRSVAYTLAAGTQVYGGFGPGALSIGSRDPVAHPTIISGEIGTAAANDNSFHLVTCQNLAEFASMDGFIFQGSYSVDETGYAANKGGGAFTAVNSSPALQNCIFRNNAAVNGGAVWSTYQGATRWGPSLVNCQFQNNSATNAGGALCFDSMIRASNDRFFGNTAAQGGAVAVIGANTTAGGDNGDYRFEQGLFWNNSATAGTGGAIYAQGGNLLVLGCTLYGNSAATSSSSRAVGGGIYYATYAQQSSGATVTDTILSGNTVTNNGSGGVGTLEKAQFASGSPSDDVSVDHCIVSGLDKLRGSTASGFNAAGNIDADPQFSAPGLTLTADFHLNRNSPAINGGTDITHYLDNPLDLDGNARILVGTEDIGVYEYTGPVEGNGTRVGGAVTSSTTTNTGITVTTLTAATQAPTGTTLQWQVNRGDGKGWVTLTASSVYSGVNSATLTITNAPYSENGDQFRLSYADGPTYTFYTPITRLKLGAKVVYVDAAATGAADGSSWADACTDLYDALDLLTPGAALWVKAGTYYPTVPGASTDVGASLRMVPGASMLGGFAGYETDASQRDPRANVTIISGDLAAANSLSDPLLSNTLVTIDAVNDGLAYDRTTVLDGFTVSRAAMYGVNVNGASPTIRNCVFANNLGSALNNQGNSSPVVTDCEFLNNDSRLGGAAVSSNGGAPTLESCLFAGNTNAAHGAVYASGGTLAINHCTFYANVSPQDGAAVYSTGGVVTITNSILWRNVGSDYGLAGSDASVYADPPDYLSISNSCVQGATPGTNGIIATDPLFTDPLALDFTPSTFSPVLNRDSGTVALFSSKDVLGRSRIVGNAADLGAFECQSPAAGNVVAVDLLQTPHVTHKTNSASDSVSFTAVNTAGGGAVFQWQIDLNDGHGFANVIPGIPNVSAGHTVTVVSAGSVSTLTITNVAAGTDVVSARTSVAGTGYTSYVARGDVLRAVPIYVNPAAAGANNGTTWTDAYTALDPALASATAVNDLWIAAGTYAPASSPFQSPVNVGLYGGFAGAETDFSQRDWVAHPVILHQAASGTGRILSCEYASAPAGDNTSILDGLVFENAQATDAAVYTNRRKPAFANCVFRNQPVAVLNLDSGPSFNNCEFTGNGVALSNNSAQVMVTQGNFHDNSSAQGSISSIIENNSSSSLQLTDCKINRNNGWNGFVENSLATLSLLRCDVRDNVGNVGGVIYNDYASLTVEDCLFVNNQTANYGGVINSFNYDSPGVYTFLVTNSAFVQNYAQYGGGALNNDADTAGGTVANCIFWDNTTGVISIASDGTPTHEPLELQQIRDPSHYFTIHHSTVQGLSTITGPGNIAWYPFFADPSNGDYHPTQSSPTANAGDRSVLTSSLDLDSLARVYGSTVDLGPYELHGTSLPVRVLAAPGSVKAPVLSSTAFSVTQPAGGHYTFYWEVWNPATSQWQYIVNPPDPNASPFYHVVLNGATSSLVFDSVSTDLTGLQFRLQIGAGGSVAYTSPTLTVTVLQPQVLHVNAAVASSGDGTTWATAFKTLGEAIVATRAGTYASTEIWVAAGTYTGPVAISPEVQLYGGFSGTETARAQRNWTANLTTLTLPGDGDLITTQNSPAAGHALLDGFTLSGNTARGLVIYDGSSPAFTHCTFDGLGSGVYSGTNAGPAFTACTFRNLAGGAIVTSGNSLTLDGCTFQNIASSNGTVFSYSGALKITNSQFTGMTGGPVLELIGATATTISRSQFTGNATVSALIDQAGSGTTLQMDNTLIARNQTTGGSLIRDESGATLGIAFSTIADNQHQGAAIGVTGGAAATVNYSILWGNRNTLPLTQRQQQGVTGLTTAQACILPNANGATLTVYRGILEGEYAYTNENYGYDPLFANPGAGDYSLGGNSPAIGRGDAYAAAVFGTVDLAGNPRVYPLPSGSPDDGAYEFQSSPSATLQLYGSYGSQRVVAGVTASFTFMGPGDPVQWQVDRGDGNGFVNLSAGGNVAIQAGNPQTLTLSNVDLSMSGYQYRFVISGAHPYTSPASTLTVVTKPIRYVNSLATGTGDGTSWANAYPNLYNALSDIAVSNFNGNPEITAEIWVAAGTYHFGTNSGTLSRGVEIYGGFAGGETVRTARNSAANVVTITGSGSLLFGYTDKPDSIYGDPVVDGLTLTGAQGGISKNAGNLTVSNCQFSGLSGGGIFNNGGTLLVQGSTFTAETNAFILAISPGGTATGNLGSVLVQHCQFQNGTNAAVYSGAGTLAIEDSTFRNNTSTNGGSPCLQSYDNQAATTVTRCQFLGNTATFNRVSSSGGAIGVQSGVMTIRQSLFAGNSGASAGAIVSNGTLQLYGVTVADNTVSSTDNAGAVFADNGYFSANNCLFWGNKAARTYGTAILRQVVTYNATSSVNTTAQENAYLTTDGGYAGNSYDPRFTGGGDYHLTSSSPYIGLGSTSSPNVLSGETDLAGNSRVTNGKTDYGAYQNGVSINPIAVTGPPASVTQAIGGNVTLTIGGALSNVYVWRFSDDGGATWKSLSLLPGYVTSNLSTQNGVSTLTLSNVPLSLSGYLFQVSLDGQAFASAPVSVTVVLPAPIYVDGSAPAGGDGRSWATAYQSLDTAISAVTVARRILYVAEGTYVPAGSFSIQQRMEIYGGYPAGGDTIASPRDPVAHPTILSGLIPNSSSRASAVVSIYGGFPGINPVPQIQADTILDGLTIEDGQQGINATFANPTIRNVLVQGNSNGGLFGYYLGGAIEDCRFLGNTGVSGAGASLASGSTVTVSRCIFQDNVATYDGGGLEITASGVRLADVLISGNTAAQQGGGLAVYTASPTVESSTVTGNWSGYGGGVYAQSATPVFLDSILWGNRSGSQAIEDEQLSVDFGSFDILACDIEGVSRYAGAATGADPVFVSGIDAADAPTLAGDFRLSPSSPLINAGVSQYATAETDLAGEPRFYGVIDLGAYEYQGEPDATLAFTQQPQDLVFSRLPNAANQFQVALAASTFTYQWESSKGGADFTSLGGDSRFGGAQTSTLTVFVGDFALDGTLFRCRVTSATGAVAYSSSALLTVYPARFYVNALAADDTGDGLTWATAMKTLTRATATTRFDPATGIEVWVAAGTYVTTGGNDTTATFTLQDKVSLYGGFAGGETALTGRDPVAHPAVLSGIAGTNAIITSKDTGTASIDGFTISTGSNGVTSGPSMDLAVANCSFTGLGTGISKVANASDTAAGAHVLTVQNSRFDGLTGDAILNANGSLVVTDSVFTGNARGVEHSGGYVQILRSEFRGNGGASGYGGGLLLGQAYASGSNVASSVESSLFSGNVGAVGGGIYAQGSTFYVRNCTFAGNYAAQVGGGVYFNSSLGGFMGLTNSVAWGNASGLAGTSEEGQIWPGPSAPVFNNSVQNADLQNGAFRASSGNVSIDPSFVQGITAGPTPTVAGNFRLSSLSPLINLGSNAYLGASATDLAQAPRVFGPAVDLGAYEFQGAILVITSQPADAAAGSGVAASYSVATNATNASYQWQVSTDGGATFANLGNSANEQGVTTAILTVAGVPTYDGRKYRVHVTTPQPGDVVSRAANYRYSTVVAGSELPAFNETLTGLTDAAGFTLGGRPVDATSVTDATFAVHAMETGRLSLQTGLTVSGSSVALNPPTPFKAGELVEVTVTSGVRDTSGFHVSPIVYQFHAGSTSRYGLFPGKQNVASVPSGATSLAMGDLNGDGTIDLIVGGANGATVLLNNGNLHFTTGQTVSSGGVSKIALGSFGFPGVTSGRLDLVLVKADGTVEIWKNNGDGTFTPAQTLAGVAGTAVGVGDFNADGALDLFIATVGADQVWFNDGTGTFYDSGQRLGIGAGVDVAVGDLNNDGSLDVVVANGAGNLEEWLNNGAGVFTATPFSHSASPADRVFLADVDGNGTLDVLTARAGSPILVWINYGSGFTSQPINGTDGGQSGWTCVGDLNGDGRPDVIAASVYDGAATLRLGAGYNPNTGYTDFPLLPEQPALSITGQGSLADLDGDGRMDLVAVSADGVVQAAAYEVIDQSLDENQTASLSPTAFQTIYNGTPTYGSGRTLAAIQVTSLPANGVLTQNGTSVTVGQVIPLGSMALTFQPTTDTYGFTSFTWQGSADGTNFGAESYRDNVLVSHVPQTLHAQPDQFTVQEGGTVTGNVLTNDANGDSLTARMYVPPAHGTVTLSADGTFTYTHDGSKNPLTDQFTYQATDASTNDTSTAVVSLTIINRNDPPSDITFSDAHLYEQSPVGTVAGVLTGADPDVAYSGDVVTLSLEPGALDDAEFTVDGQNLRTNAILKYADGPTRQVRVRATDSHGLYIDRDLTVSLKSLPLALAQSVTLLEDGSVSVALAGFCPDGRPITGCALAGGAQHGATVLNGAAAVYTPTPLFYGSDAFTFTVSDGTMTSAPATVSLNVTHVNHPPVADPQTLAVTENTPLNFTATGRDVDNDPLTFLIFNSSGKGTITGTSPNFTFTPGPDQTGSFQLILVANDGTVNSADAVVSGTISVVDYPPIVSALNSYLTPENQALPVTLLARDRNGKPLTYRITVPPAHGTVSGTGPAVVYTPAKNYYGTDSFQFVANNGVYDSAAGTVAFQVQHVNQPPVAHAQQVVTNQTQPVGITLAADDADGDTLTYTVTRAPQHGALTGAGANLTYTPTGIFSGADSFEFAVSDGQYTSTAVVGITVNVVDLKPTANAQTVPGHANVPATFALTGSDPKGLPLTYTIVSLPAHGTLTGSLPNAVIFTPTQNYSGTDALVFKVNNGALDSDPATVTINLPKDLEVAPTVQDDYVTGVFKGETRVIDVLANDSDFYGDPLQIVSVTTPTSGSVVISADQKSLSFTAADSSATFRYTVSNGSPYTATASVFVTVVNQNLVVTSSNDSGPGTLRDVIATINKSSRPLDPGWTVSFSTGITGQTLQLGTSDASDPDSALVVSGNVNIAAGLSPVPVIQVDTSAGPLRAFHVLPGANLRLNGVTVTGGEANLGGAVFNEGTLTIDQTTLTANTAVAVEGQPGQGGAIFTTGTLNLTNAVLTDNVADSGGGFYQLGNGTAAATVINTATLSGHAASGDFLSTAINGGTASIDATALTTQTPTAPWFDALPANVTIAKQFIAKLSVLTNGDAFPLTATSSNPDLAGVAWTGRGTARTLTLGGFTPVPGAQTRLTATATDGSVSYVQHTGITVDPASARAPVALDDHAAVPTGGSVLIPVLANDYDPDGGALTIDSVSAPAFGGSATIENNQIRFTHNGDVSGINYGFSYVVRNAAGLTATANVSILRTTDYTLPVYYADDNGAYTLRDALATANQYYAPGGWLIRIDASFADDNGGPVLVPASAGDHGVGDSAFLVTGNVTIDATAVPGFMIYRDASGPAMRLFRVTDAGSLTLVNATLNGGVSSHGGVLLNEGAAKLDHSTVENGTADVGGGVFNEGTLVTDTATLTQNTAGSYGGALYNRNGTAAIHGSTLSNNTAIDGGGVGLFGNDDASAVQLFDTTVNNPGAPHDLAATVTGAGTTVLTATGATAVAVPGDTWVDPITDRSMNDTASVPFTYTAPASATISAVSDNEAVVANAGLSLTGLTAGSGTLQVQSRSSGYAPVAVLASKGPISFGQKFELTVHSVNNLPPVAADDFSTLYQGGQATVDVLANDSDPEGAPLILQSVGAAQHGTVVQSGSSVIYTHDGSDTATDTFTYVVSDGFGGTATGTVHVTLVPTTLSVTSTGSDDSAGTIRQALEYAAAHPTTGTWKIVFDPSIPANSTIYYGNYGPYYNGYTMFHVAGNVLLDGSQVPGLTIASSGGQSGPPVRFFHVETGASLELRSLILTKGVVQVDGAPETGQCGGGGVVLNEGTFVARAVTFLDNAAPGNVGGALASSGTATLVGCTFTGNTATAGTDNSVRQLGTGLGGAIFQVNGMLTVTDCTFNNNSAADGVSIHTAGDADHAELDLTGSTLACDAATNSQVTLTATNGGTVTRNSSGNTFPDGETAPWVGSIAATTSLTGPLDLPVTLGIPANDYTVSASASPAAKLASIQLTGSDANRTLSVTPAAGASGPLGLTVTLADGALTVNETFPATIVGPVPAAPTGLTALAVSDSQIALAWTDNAASESSYTVERSGNGVDGWAAVTSTLAAHATSYVDSSLPATSQQFYRVRCDLAGVDSDNSNVASATTSAAIGDGIPGWWRYQYFGDGTKVVPGSEPNADPDGDGVSNLQEYLAGTDPTDPASALKLQLSRVGAKVVLSFPTIAGRVYQVEATGDLGSPAVWTVLSAGIAGTNGVVTYTDTTASGLARRFYRISVHP